MLIIYEDYNPKKKKKNKLMHPRLHGNLKNKPLLESCRD